MKRAALLLLLVAVPLIAAEDNWYAAYNRGVEAVRGGRYQVGANALQRAIAEMPNEGTNVRYGNTLITYVPHFWLGIAKYNLGDIDGSLRELKTSEEQGVVQSTIYFTELRNWIARAQTEKQRNSEAGAARNKKKAADAIGRATSAQLDAVGAGGDRTEQYRAAFAKLREANQEFQSAGTNIAAYDHVSDLAGQANDLFAAATDAAQKEKAARAQQRKPAPPPVVVVPFEPETPKPPPPAPAPVVEPKELVDARVALQEYRRHLFDAHTLDHDVPKLDAELRGTPDPKVVARVAADIARKEQKLADSKKPVVSVPAPAPVTPSVSPLEPAWRAFATGDLAGSEQRLTTIIAATPSPEAYLLRGCARYTRGVLSGHDDAVAAAAEDFRAALRQNATLRLDPTTFSPKLIAFFEKVRDGK